MVAFTATLLVYILGLFGVTLNQPLEIGAAVRLLRARRA